METNAIQAAAVSEQVSLVALLDCLGYQPKKRSGKELKYISMIADSGFKPAFTVNEELGVWYDHGLGKGGNVVDFGLIYWKGLSFPDILERITANAVSQRQKPGSGLPQKPRRKRMVRVPYYHIKQVNELGSNPVITAYLKSRGIWTIAQGKMSEVSYYIEDHKKLQKRFCAVGWKNELGWWEVRNVEFKGCLGHKAMTFVPGDPAGLILFIGYISYLSWLFDNPGNTKSVLILNSFSLVQAAIRKAREFPMVELYFDRNKAGHQATMDFIEQRPDAVDRTAAFAGYKDYNDKLLCALGLPKSPIGR
jgi:hypothetical protein